MRFDAGICALSLGLLVFANEAQATVSIHIDLSTQTMHVSSSDGSYDWPVSTARSGYVTPRGSYRPTSLQLMHYSRKYDMTPMPHSIFFAGGYAIHGSYATGSLGRPASHGCIRLSPGHAATLYEMVQQEGARISISGTPPQTRHYASALRTHRSVIVARSTRAYGNYGSYGSYGNYGSYYGSYGSYAYAPVRRVRPWQPGLQSWQLEPLRAWP